MSPDLAQRLESLEKRVTALEAARSPAPAARAAARPAAASGAPKSAPVRRLAVGEEMRGRFMREVTVDGQYGPHLALILALEGGALVTLSCAHKALDGLVRKMELAEGDLLVVQRLADETMESGKTRADYRLDMQRAERGGPFD